MQQGKQYRMRFMWYYIAKDSLMERITELWPWRYRYYKQQLRKFMK